LTIFFKQDIFVLELKIKHDKHAKADELDQLSGYLDKLGQNRGYLLLFETRPSGEITWEERIKWEEIEHVFLVINRKIVVIEM
jgi:hypothetical protein